jgi:hypothetical protein
MKTLLLFLCAFLFAGCTIEAQPILVDSSKTERFNAAPLDSFTYDVPKTAVAWRLVGNPDRSSSPFVETMWFSLADGDNLDFFHGDELGADRLAQVPVGNAKVLHVDNAGGQLVAGAIVWGLREAER